MNKDNYVFMAVTTAILALIVAALPLARWVSVMAISMLFAVCVWSLVKWIIEGVKEFKKDINP